MASLHSILILGPDTVSAASPATPVQLVHACRRWGYASVVPASWGDELIASYVIHRCAGSENRPMIQCSCPRVSDRLGSNAALLEEAVVWLVSPPVAVARYLRALEEGRDVHVTYAGGCPGAVDPSIDQWISATELLLSLGSRGIDITAQPTVFEDVIPPDRRRHFSSPGGLPEPQRLWEAAAFRCAQPAEGDLTLGITQLLLTDDRLLIDLAPALGCICRGLSPQNGDGSTTPLRAPSPVVLEGKIDVRRSAPTPTPPLSQQVERPLASATPSDAVPERLAKPSSGRQALRRQSIWRRQSPRPGVVVARPSTAVAAAEVPLLRRPETRFIIIAALILATSLAIGIWIGRRSASRGAVGIIPRGSPAALAQLERPRSR